MQIYTDVLSEPVLSKCLLELQFISDQPVWKCSNLFWGDDMSGTSVGVVVQAILSPHIAQEVDHELHEYFSVFYKEAIIEYQYFVWNRLSEVPIHNDSHNRFGAVIYLNPEWQPNWGGMFLWKDKNESDPQKWDSLCPKYNMMILNDEQENHLVTPMSVFAPHPRVTIQIWGKHKSKNPPQ